MVRFLFISFSFAVGVASGALGSILMADPICDLFGVTSFEGASGYFMLFFVAPIAGVVTGTVLGGLTAIWTKKYD